MVASANAKANGAAVEFPGCKPIRISRDEIDCYEGRYEYWEARTETAWQVQSPTSLYHELPSQRLARLSDRIAAVRGSPIESFGTGDLLVRDEEGKRHRILQADQILFMHPGRSKPLGHAVEVNHGDLPDVVLEVDLTTDVRRGKLGIYESWGFPEVWVEVPDTRAPSTPKSRPSGLTMHLLVDGRYQVATESMAFPGWTASEIHLALNEDECSAETVETLLRVGGLLGERGDTGPDDDLFLAAQRRDSREEGRMEGFEKAMEAMEILEARGIAISQTLFRARDVIFATPLPVLQRAAFACTDVDDFLRRIEGDAT